MVPLKPSFTTLDKSNVWNPLQANTHRKSFHLVRVGPEGGEYECQVETEHRLLAEIFSTVERVGRLSLGEVIVRFCIVTIASCIYEYRMKLQKVRARNEERELDEN